MLAAASNPCRTLRTILKKARWGARLTHGEMTDAMWELLHSGSGLLGEAYIMGQTAENSRTNMYLA